MPDQLVNLDMKHGVEAKNYEEVSVWGRALCLILQKDTSQFTVEVLQRWVIIDNLVILKAELWIELLLLLFLLGAFLGALLLS